MSFDPSQNNPAPVGHVVPPKKSGAKKWIFGGLGCFGLLAILCIGGLYMTYSFGMGIVKNSAYETARSTIESDEAVREAVGAPVVVGEFNPADFQQKQLNGGEIEYTYGLTVDGKDKSGRAEVIVSGTPVGEGGWEVDSIDVEVDGVNIPVGEVDLDINIEEE